MTLSLTCECKSWEFRHTTLIAKLAESGATFAFPFEMQSSRDPRKTYTVRQIDTNPPVQP